MFSDDILCLKGKQQIEGRESMDVFTSNENSQFGDPLPGFGFGVRPGGNINPGKNVY